MSLHDPHGPLAVNGLADNGFLISAAGWHEKLSVVSRPNFSPPFLDEVASCFGLCDPSNMRIYLDNCSFNRPFDDQKQTRIRLEAEAKLCLQQHIREGEIELVWSYILDFENNANPFKERKETIAKWRYLSQKDVSENAEVLSLAERLQAGGFRSKDALHIACAVTTECDYFVTTDDNILKRQSAVKEITLCDPTRAVRELEL